MSGGLPGLMKYRYQKKVPEKLNSVASSEKNITGIHKSPGTTANPSSPILQSAPYQCQSQSPGSSSPVIQKPRHMTQDHSSVISPHKTCYPLNSQADIFSSPRNQHIMSVQPSSPQSPVISTVKNGYAEQQTSQSHVNHHLSSPSHSCQGSEAVSSVSPGYSVTAEDREILVNVSSLQTMFPNKHRDEIEQALRAAKNNFDIAVDFLIDNKFAEYTIRANRRKRDSGEYSSGSSPIHPPAKRVRRLSFEDSFDDLTSNTRSIPAKTEAQIMMEKVNSLQNKFPLLPRQVIASALTDHDCDEEKACKALSNISEKQVSQTENVGSIKAMRQARVLAMAMEKASPSSSKTLQAEVSTNKVKQKARHRVQLNDSISDEEWKDDDDDDDDESYDEESGQEGLVVKFFNEAAMSDLLCIDGCSKRKADAVMNLRPFKSWQDLVSQFEGCKFLSMQLISNCRELLRVRDVVQKLISRCERISRNIENVISDLTSHVSLDDSCNDYIRQQPSILNPEMQLTPYQLVGLNWLVVMHEQELNGILGDDMGLGKTIQTIAFLAYMKEHGEDGPHLVIAPSSTLDNWLRELKTWCPSLKVMMYYGNQEERAVLRHQLISGCHEEFDVALTTYNMATGIVEDRSLFKKFNWHYAIFDEGHMLKNMSSMRYKTLTRIRTNRRLLLTGTPLQNSLIELMSLLAFVMPDIFTSKTEYLKKIFSTMSGKSTGEQRSKYEMENIAHAKQILKPFFLRRLKIDVLQQLPKKVEIVKMISLSAEQRELYNSLKERFSKTLKEEGLNSQSGSAMMMQLRKAANHQLLHRKQYDTDKLKKMALAMLKEPTHFEAVEQYVFEDMEVMSDFELHQLCKRYKSLHQYQLNEDMILNSGKFKFLDELLPEAQKEDSRVLLFSQFTMMLDIIEVYMKKRGYKFLRLDGNTPVAERQEMIDTFNTDNSVLVFLLSTKAGGLGINLVSANVVVLHDIDFNPYNDKQAEDRCYRLGQKREVKVYRLIASNTIEEGIMKCAQGKLQLEQDITGSKKGSKLDKADVASLLKDALAIDC